MDDAQLAAARALCETATPGSFMLTPNDLVPQLLDEIDRLKQSLVAAQGNLAVDHGAMLLLADTIVGLRDELKAARAEAKQIRDQVKVELVVP